jgi:hypothetical protein
MARNKISKALRALITARSKEPVAKALGELCQRDESPSHDRELALVATVFVEDALRNAILRSFAPERVEWSKTYLFEEELAPLSSMAARTRMAFALGLIPDEMRQDLTTLRAIRVRIR